MISNLELHECAKAMKANTGYCEELVEVLQASVEVLEPFDGKVFNCKLEKALYSAGLTVGGKTVGWTLKYYDYGLEPDKQDITVEVRTDYNLPYLCSWIRETTFYKIPLKLVGRTYRFDFKAYEQAIGERIFGLQGRIDSIEKSLRGKQFAKDLQRMAELSQEYAKLYDSMNFVVKSRFERAVKRCDAVQVYDGLDFDKVDNTDYAEELVKKQYSGADDGWGYSDGVCEELARIIKNDHELSARDLSNPKRDSYEVTHMILCNEKPDAFWKTMVEAMQRIGDAALQYDETADEYTCSGKDMLFDMFLKSWGKHDGVADFIDKMQELL